MSVAIPVPADVTATTSSIVGTRTAVANTGFVTAYVVRSATTDRICWNQRLSGTWAPSNDITTLPSQIATNPESFSLASVNNILSIAYHAPGYLVSSAPTNSLLYGYYNGSTWTHEVVDTGLTYDVGRYCCIADINGFPGIVYFDMTNQYVKYAQYNGLTWDITIIATADIRRPMKIIASPLGYPSIVYTDYSTNPWSIVFGEYDGTTWTLTTINTSTYSDPAAWEDIGYTSIGWWRGRPRIAYQIVYYWPGVTGSASNMFFSHRLSGVWYTNLAETYYSCGNYMDMFISGGVHIVNRTDSAGTGGTTISLYTSPSQSGTAWTGSSIENGQTPSSAFDTSALTIGTVYTGATVYDLRFNAASVVADSSSSSSISSSSSSSSSKSSSSSSRSSLHSSSSSSSTSSSSMSSSSKSWLNCIGMSNYLENILLNMMFNNVEYVSAKNVYVGLLTSLVVASDGDTYIEVSGDTYARQLITFGEPMTDGAIYNSKAVAFPHATVPWSVQYIGIFDAATGGNLLYWGQLAAPVTIIAGHEYTIDAGQCIITLGDGITSYLSRLLLNITLRNRQWTNLYNWYIGALTSWTWDQEFTEPDPGSAYVRKCITMGTATASTCASAATVSFSVALASWGTIVKAGLFNQAIGGQLLFQSDLAAPTAVGGGNRLRFAAGGVSVTLD